GIDQPGNFHFLAGAISLMDVDQVCELIAELRRLEIGFLIIDTLARSMVGGDENATRDMSLAVANCERIRAEVGCDLLLVHHAGYDESHARGSTALRAAVDTQLALRGDPDDLALKAEKHRDWESGFEACLRLTVIELDDGLTSCVVERRSTSTGGIKQVERK